MATDATGREVKEGDTLILAVKVIRLVPGIDNAVIVQTATAVDGHHELMLVDAGHTISGGTLPQQEPGVKES